MDEDLGSATPSSGAPHSPRSVVSEAMADAAEGASVAAEGAASAAAVPAVTGKPRHLTSGQRRRVVRSVRHAERATGAQFCVYLGPTSDDPRAHAHAMFEEAGLHTRPAILLLVSPEGRRVEVVTSAETQDRVSDLTCAEAVSEMTRFFGRSDLAGGIVAGIERLQAAAGPASGKPSAATFPDLFEG